MNIITATIAMTSITTNKIITMVEESPSFESEVSAVWTEAVTLGDFVVVVGGAFFEKVDVILSIDVVVTGLVETIVDFGVIFVVVIAFVEGAEVVFITGHFLELFLEYWPTD